MQMSFSSEPAPKTGFPIWIVILIIAVILCCCLACLILIIAGPAISNIFASVNQGLGPTP
jgi:hypothetical protein